MNGSKRQKLSRIKPALYLTLTPGFVFFQNTIKLFPITKRNGTNLYNLPTTPLIVKTLFV